LAVLELGEGQMSNCPSQNLIRHFSSGFLGCDRDPEMKTCLKGLLFLVKFCQLVNFLKKWSKSFFGGFSSGQNVNASKMPA